MTGVSGLGDIGAPGVGSGRRALGASGLSIMVSVC